MSQRLRTILLSALTVSAALLTAAPAAPAQAGGGVLIVGDSLEVGTSPYLEALLPGVPLTVDAEESRSSAAVLDALQSRIDSSQSVVVFDAGTNDDPASPQTLAANLRAAAGIAGPRCMVVATINRPPFNGYSADGLNAAVSSFVAARPGTQLVDWRSAALANPGLIYSDGVHPDSNGYQLRAQLIARGIQGCLVGGATSVPAQTPNPVPPQPVQPEPEAPSPADRARQRAEAARLVGAEVISRVLALAGRQDPAGAAMLASLLFRAP